MSFAYEMGLRSARCNGCAFAKLKHELGDKFYALNLDNHGWITVYELDAKPLQGQG